MIYRLIVGTAAALYIGSLLFPDFVEKLLALFS